MSDGFESEVYQVEIQTTGEAEARKGAKAVESVEVATDDMAKAAGRGRDALGRFTAGMGQMEGQATRVAGASRAAGQGVQDLGQGVVQVGTGFKASGNSLQVFAQGLDDLQYVPEQGLRPILNNLIQISPALGIVGLGVQQLVIHWGDLTEFFTGGTTKSEAEQMEELGKSTSRTADETARLLKYKEGLKHIEAQGQRPEATTKFGQAVDKAITEGPLDAIDRGLDKHFGARIQAMADAHGDLGEDGRAAAQEKDRKAREMIQTYEADPKHRSQFYPMYLEAQKTLQDSYGGAREKFRTGTLTDPANAGTLRRVQDAARANPRDFGGDVAAKRFVEAIEEALDPAGKAAEEFYKKQDAEIASRKAAADEALRASARDDEAANEKYDRDREMEIASKKAEADEKLRVDQREDEKKEEEHYRAQEEEFSSRKAEAEQRVRDDQKDRARKLVDFRAGDGQGRAEEAARGTGLDARGEMAMTRSMLAGGTRDQVEGRVAQAIAREQRAAGVDPESAMKFARDKAASLYGSVGDDVTSRAMNPERRPVERIGVGDFARSVESAGQKKMESLTEEMKNYLAEIRKNTANAGLIRSGN